ncbi:MAG: hypothetical protein KKF79_05560, partial [Gammaproteobacteria bacterium]|nr:hypothetical protein [Gammaproteobacteria bacterium]
MQFFLQNLAPKALRTVLRTLLMTVLGGLGFATSVSIAIASTTPEAKPPLSMWLTTGDQQQLLQRDVGSLLQPFQATAPTIELNSAERHQQMDGFGYTLTGGSAIHLMTMSAPARAALLRELFTSQGIGVSYLRVSLG